MKFSLLLLASAMGILSSADARAPFDNWFSAFVKGRRSAVAADFSREDNVVVQPRLTKGKDVVLQPRLRVAPPNLVMPRETKNFIPVQDRAVALESGSYELQAGKSVVIKSANFPKKYPKNAEAFWSFYTADPTATITLKCKKLIIRKSKECMKSYLYIYHGSEDYELLCGKNNNYELTSVANYMDIFFWAGNRKPAKGFKCTVTASAGQETTTVTEASVTTTTEASVTTTSDNNNNQNSDCLSCGTVNRATRIVGGEETEVNEYPWQVALVYAGTNSVFCGGSVYNELYVITAAHCGEAMINYQIDTDVLFGAHNVGTNSPAPQRVRVSSIINHPDYNNNNLDNDIAVLRLADRVTLSEEVKPACLPDPSKDYVQYNAIVSGWGALTQGGSQPSALQEVEVPVISNSECSESYGSGITDNMMCAGYQSGGKDSCQGDSGGPMAIQDGDKWVLAGVVSWGYGCAQPNYPGVYARVTQYIDWIKEQTSEGSSLCTDGNSGGQQTSAATTAASTTVTTPSVGSSSCACGVPNRVARIVGGEETQVHEYPWQAALIGYGGSQPFCGASIISDRWILTAAHCLPGMTTSNSQVLIGEHNWNSGSETSLTQKLDIEQLVSHPSYSSSTFDNDIALIKVASTISFPSDDNRVAPVCLPTSSSTFDNVDAIVSGWGTLSSGGSQPYVLNDVTVPTMSNSKCQQSYGSSITDNMICAGLDEGGKDSCQGDSGGPLVTAESGNSYLSQIGVVSFGYGCAYAGYPGVYARVSNYNDWIQSYISDSNTCSPPV